MREAFSTGRADEVIALFNGLGDTVAIRSGIRIEAICLAARAYAAKGERRPARQMVAPLLKRDYSSARLYGYLAAVMLDLRDYATVAALCRKAAELDAAKAESAA